MQLTFLTHFSVRWGLMLILFGSSAAWANGTLTHMSGQVMIEKVDGSKVTGAPGMQVVPGDILVTGEKGFVRMELTDGGEMVLRPHSKLKIEKYFFEKNKPAEDSFVFDVIKGGFRAVSGLISKRGNQDAYQAKSPTAVMGIRGTQFDLRVCQGDCGALPAGTYVAVKYGAITAGNTQGNADFKAGQVGFVSHNQIPVQLPRDPGIGFTPPPSIPKLDEKKKQAATAADTKTAPAQTKTAGTDSKASPAEVKAAPAETKETAQTAVGESTPSPAPQPAADSAPATPATAPAAPAPVATETPTAAPAPTTVATVNPPAVATGEVIGGTAPVIPAMTAPQPAAMGTNCFIQ